MSYVVYVNGPVNRAIVHSQACHKYQNHLADRTPNGFWTDPFVSFETAWAFAQSTGKKTVDKCAFCCR